MSSASWRMSKVLRAKWILSLQGLHWPTVATSVLSWNVCEDVLLTTWGSWERRQCPLPSKDYILSLCLSEEMILLFCGTFSAFKSSVMLKTCSCKTIIYFRNSAVCLSLAWSTSDNQKVVLKVHQPDLHKLAFQSWEATYTPWNWGCFSETLPFWESPGIYHVLPETDYLQVKSPVSDKILTSLWIKLLHYFSLYDSCSGEHRAEAMKTSPSLWTRFCSTVWFIFLPFLHA